MLLCDLQKTGATARTDSLFQTMHLSKVESKQLTDAKISTVAQHFDEENDEELYVCGVRVKWHITTNQSDV